MSQDPKTKQVGLPTVLDLCPLFQKATHVFLTSCSACPHVKF